MELERKYNKIVNKNYKKCKTLDEIRAKIDEYMYYYNNDRYQWGLNKMTPLEYKNLIALSC